MKIFELIRRVSDEELVERCQKNEARAQKELYERFASKMLVVCKRYVVRYEIAEELMSNGFIKAFKAVTNLEKVSSFGGWLRQIMVRECLDYLKSVKLEYASFDEILQTPASKEFDIQAELQAEDLLKIVENLPAGYRTVFNLYAIEGFKHFEIAQLLGISESTSKTQLMKSRDCLQKMIIELENNEKKSNEKIG